MPISIQQPTLSQILIGTGKYGREIHGTSSKALESAFKRAIIKNIANDRFTVTDFNFPQDSYIRMARAKHFIALRIGTQTSLWNILEHKKLWECPQTPPIEPANSLFKFLNTLKVNPQGNVAYVYEENTGIFPKHSKRIELFHEGQQTASFSVPYYLKHFELIDSNFFGIGLVPDPTQKSALFLTLFQWDLSGKLLKSHNLGSAGGDIKTAFNEQTLVIAVDTIDNPSGSPKIFIYDLLQQKIQLFALQSWDMEEVFGSMCLTNDRIFLGSSVYQADTHSKKEPKKESDPVLYAINLKTTSVETLTLDVDTGIIQHLTIEGSTVFFVIHTINEPDIVCSFDLVSNTQKQLLKIQNIFQISVCNSILIICHFTGAHSENQSRTVFDLKQEKILHEMEYVMDTNSPPMSFNFPAFAIPEKVGSEFTVHVENFLSSDPDVVECKSPSRITPPTGTRFFFP